MTEVPDEYEGIIGYGYLEAADKLKECSFFLDLMMGTTDWNQFRWLTSAYLNAARAVMDWLASSAFYAIPDDTDGSRMEQDDEAIAILSQYMVLKHEKKTGKVYASPRDPLLKDLCQHRKVSAHEGPLWIKPEKVRDPTEFRFWSGDTPVLDFARKVLALLKKIQNEVCPDS
jgi:hypothetical protein